MSTWCLGSLRALHESVGCQSSRVGNRDQSWSVRERGGVRVGDECEPRVEKHVCESQMQNVCQVSAGTVSYMCVENACVRACDSRVENAT